MTPLEITKLSNFDIHLIREGTHYKSYEHLGAHKIVIDGKVGFSFTVWAPNAQYVSVIGDFNSWDKKSNPMKSKGDCGVWEIFIEGVKENASYKYYVESGKSFYSQEKADPYAFYAEVPPLSASKTFDVLSTRPNDSDWMAKRDDKNNIKSPILIYEVHLGSWRKTLENQNLSYLDLAQQLAEYVNYMGFTHIELLPITEHPYDLSWGYQTTSYYAPTSRFGSPDDFKSFIEIMHSNNIGVILDWVPAHFPEDGHGLAFFDGTSLYEHQDPREGKHQDWGTLIFNYGRTEVANFLISNALFWLDTYHLDGLRVDAVASMIYRDYSRKEGEWVPNKYGGRENLEALDFLKKLNEKVYEAFPSSMTIAEESTSWPRVSRPTYSGGLGFGFKWNMGWMNDTLRYFSKDPIHRSYHHSELTFSMLYAFEENFILPLSHDEVVHGKGSIISKMPGDFQQKFANCRLLYSYMYAHPGKKLLFMGAEFCQWGEWDCRKSLDWHLTQYKEHKGVQNLVRDLNFIVRNETSLHQEDFSWRGFEWVDCNDYNSSVLSFLRWSEDYKEVILCVFNFTPIDRYEYSIGVPFAGKWKEIFNSNSEGYGGSNLGNMGEIYTKEENYHNKNQKLTITLPGLSAVYFKPISN